MLAREKARSLRVETTQVFPLGFHPVRADAIDAGCGLIRVEAAA